MNVSCGFNSQGVHQGPKKSIGLWKVLRLNHLDLCRANSNAGKAQLWNSWRMSRWTPHHCAFANVPGSELNFCTMPVDEVLLGFFTWISNQKDLNAGDWKVLQRGKSLPFGNLSHYVNVAPSAKLSTLNEQCSTIVNQWTHQWTSSSNRSFKHCSKLSPWRSLETMISQRYTVYMYSILFVCLSS